MCKNSGARASTRTVEVVLFSVRRVWGERRGLNPRPSVPQTDALPAELRSPPLKYVQFRLHFTASKEGRRRLSVCRLQLVNRISVAIILFILRCSVNFSHALESVWRELSRPFFD